MCNGVVALFEKSSNYIYEGERIAFIHRARAVGEIRWLFFCPEKGEKDYDTQNQTVTDGTGKHVGA